MKKRSAVLLTAILMIYVSLCPLFVLAADTDISEFDIENGVLISYNGSETEVEIPYGVTTIGDYVFYDKKVERVILPDTVTKIGNNAFARSTLRYIDLPDGLLSIGSSAFMNTWLTEIELPYGITEIPAGAFSNAWLKSITIPDSVNKIGEYAFSNTMLNDIELPDSVTYASSTSFMGTPYLQTLIKKNGGWLILSNGLLVSYVGNDVNAVMPETVRCIGSKSFLNRSRLHSLTIPDSVKNIEDTPFLNCKPKVIYSANPLAQKLSIDCLTAPQIPPLNGKRALNIETDTWNFANEHSVFGDKYALTDTSRSILSENIETRYQKFDDDWNGSCYGLVLTVLLVKYGLLSPSDIQQNANFLKDISPDDDVKSIINHYHFLQYSKSAIEIERHSGVSNEDFFDHIITLGWQAETLGKPFILSFDTPNGGHACAGCGIESGEWEWDGRNYDRRILLWDPNLPAEYRDDVCLYYRESDYDYCIPYYGVQYTYGSPQNIGGITSATDEISVLGEPAYPFESITHVKGDVNADGILSIADIVLFQKWLLAASEIKLPKWRAADLCKDDKLDSFDLYLMKKELLYQ